MIITLNRFSEQNRIETLEEAKAVLTAIAREAIESKVDELAKLLIKKAKGFYSYHSTKEVNILIEEDYNARYFEITEQLEDVGLYDSYFDHGYQIRDTETDGVKILVIVFDKLKFGYRFRTV